ncbi:MAG: hypothetical protein AAFX87_23965 [Bacteroidota bacterium]
MDKEAFKGLEYLIRNKTYDALEDAERAWVNDQIGGEAAYMRLYDLVRTAQSEREMPLKTSSKRRLMAQFKAKHKSTGVAFINYRIPAYAVIAPVILLLVIWFLIPAKQVLIEKPVFVEREVYLPSPVQIDTVEIELPPDTVFLERVVKIPVYLSTAKEEPKKRKRIFKGRSLAEQNDVVDLVKRGR